MKKLMKNLLGSVKIVNSSYGCVTDFNGDFEIKQIFLCLLVSKFPTSDTILKSLI